MLLSTALLLSGLGSVLGGLFTTGMNAMSQGWSQDFNREEAEKARQFNSWEAEKARQFSANEASKNRLFEAQQAELTRQWQTDMSNTAYQRSMVDMQKAGINPNLLASGAMGASIGNASTPQGSQAQTSGASSSPASSSPVHFSDPFAGLTNALNAYATIQNQQMIAKLYNDTNVFNTNSKNQNQFGIAQMYSDTSRFNTSARNNMYKYATDVNASNFQQSVWKYREKPYKGKNGFKGFDEL